MTGKFFQRYIKSPTDYVTQLVAWTKAKDILDYGSGKAHYRRTPEFEAWTAKHNVNVVSHDPCVEGLDRMDEIRGCCYDGVLMLDVLEHIPEQDLPWLLKEINQIAILFFFASIACCPSSKTLADGSNSHCTVRPIVFWVDLLKSAFDTRETIVWCHFDPKKGEPRQLVKL